MAISTSASITINPIFENKKIYKPNLYRPSLYKPKQSIFKPTADIRRIKKLTAPKAFKDKILMQLSFSLEL